MNASLPLHDTTPALPRLDAVAPAHDGHDACITCGDVAVVLRVDSLAGNDARCVDGTGASEVVALDLVDAGVGDLVLVHARVALEVVDPTTPLGRQGPPR